MSSRTKLLAWMLIVAELVFVVLYAEALRRYPGGTWFDRHEPTSFWKNFLCDLEWEVSLDGRPNPIGSRAMQLGMIVLSLGFAPLWWLVPHLFTAAPLGAPPRGWALAKAIRSTGVVSSIATLAVPLTPSDRFGAWHSLAVVVAGLFGLSAAVLAVIGLARNEASPRIAAKLGLALLVTAAFDLALYVRLVAFKGDVPLVLPVLQKVALALVLGWMTVVAVAVLRRPLPTFVRK